MKSGSSSPPLKKAKLEPLSPPIDKVQTGSGVEVKIDHDGNASMEALNSDDENNCSICLQIIVNRTVIPTCSHEFCFDCVLVWTEQSRRCPLCSQAIGGHLIHSIRSRYDYRKHFLAPLRTSPPVVRSQIASSVQDTRRFARPRRREREWGIREREERDEMDKLDMSIAKRKWIYEHDLYAKHVASNFYTKYRPYPTPAQFSASPELISRTITFLRRELQVWEGLDVEFLTTMIISLMKSIDIRSETAVKLLAEFLDLDVPYIPGGRHVKAEHFAHEVYCYVRSPYRDLFVYDTVVQYDSPPDVPPPTQPRRTRRWREREASPLPRTSEYLESSPEEGLQSRSRSLSWSPSGRRYPKPREIAKASGSKSNRSLNLVVPDNVSMQDQKWPTGDERTKGQLEPDEKDERSVDYGASRVSTPDLASVSAIDRKGKGKGKRKDDNPYNSENYTALEPKSPLQQDECYCPALIDSSHSRLRPVRAAKNRNLRESVQAHLGGRETTARASVTQIISSISGTAPSLLARLSTPSLDSNQVPTAIQTQDATSVSHSEADDKDLVFSKVSSSTPRVTHGNDTRDPVTASNASLPAGQWKIKGSGRRPPSRLSKHLSPPMKVVSGSHDYGSASNLSFPASELRRDASTLHRSSDVSAEATKSSVSPRHPSSSHRHDINIELPDESHVVSPPRDQKPPNPIQSNTQLNSAPDAKLQTAAKNMLDARTRLLTRLESEKDRARLCDSPVTTTRKEPDVTSSLDISFPRDGRRRRSPITDSLGPDQVTDNVAVEAKLRLRAQLRARLAAEKRRDVDHPGTVSEILNKTARE